MIADATAVVAEILTAGGGIVRPVDTEAQEKFAWFRDPAGNLLGIYQQPGPADTEHAREGWQQVVQHCPVGSSRTTEAAPLRRLCDQPRRGARHERDRAH
jgi:hypothetical protein